MIRAAAIPEDEFERQRARGPRFARTDTNTILSTEFPPIHWVVKDYLPEGLAILAGRQKLGKTWLAIDWAIAVACGGFAMGTIACDPGDVLYVDLENGPRRIRGRIDMLFPGERNRPDLERLEWANEAPNLDKGFLHALEDWRMSVKDPRLVVIDVLQRIKPAGKAGQTSYESDYDPLSALQRWASERNIAVLCLHHTRKGGADDPLEALSGSNGLSACADTTLVLDRDANGITLYVRGRDVEERESAIKFAAGLWTMVGDASDVRRSSERGNILVTLEQADEPLSPTEIANVTGMKSGNIRKLLHTMGKAGEVRKSGRGRYILPENSEKNTGSTDPR